MRLGAALFVVATAMALWPAVGRAQPRELVLWHAYGESEAVGLEAAVAVFERQTGVRVTVLQNAHSGFDSKLENAIPTGHGPDVFIDAHERLADYLAGGLVVPIGAPGLAVRLELDAAHLRALAAGGQQYGLPLAVKCAALYVNLDLMPAVPESLEAIALVRPRLRRGSFPLVVEAETPYYVGALLSAFGGRFVSDDGSYAFEGVPAERTLELLLDFTRRGVIPEEPSGDLVRQLFVSGRAATAIDGPWLAPDLEDARFAYTVVPLPVVEAAGGRSMRPFVTVEGAFVAARSRAPRLARELVRFLAIGEGAVLRAELGGHVVVSRQAWELPELRNDEVLFAFRRAAASGIVMPVHPHQQLAWEPAQRAIRKVLRGDETPHVALLEARHRFEQVARPVPPPHDPAPLLIGVGLLLLVLATYALRRARAVDVRAELRASMPAYKWIAHAAVALLVLVVAPLVVGALASLFAGRGTDMHYVGLANYADILGARGGEPFASGSFWLVLAVTLLWTVLNVSLHVAIGVALALLLHRPALKLKAAYRVLLILPWAVPSYVTALSWKGMFHRQLGAIDAILEALGAEPVSFFGQFATAFAANLATNVWLGFPFMMVVTLGALAAIPKDLYEAAAVDGASAWQRFRLITLPMLRPMLAPAVAMGAVWTFNMFNVVFLVSGGEPDGSTEILVTEAYRWAFTRGRQYGYAAAYAVLIFGVLFLGTRWIGQKLDGAGATR